jgi:hypothetical protein
MGLDGGIQIVELVSSAMPGSPMATAAPSGCDRAIVVRPNAVFHPARPDRQQIRYRLFDARYSRPATLRVSPGASREQEIQS